MSGRGKNKPQQQVVPSSVMPSPGRSSSVSRSHTEVQLRSGPLPAPDDLAQYNAIIPNGACLTHAKVDPLCSQERKLSLNYLNGYGFGYNRRDEEHLCFRLTFSGYGF